MSVAIKATHALPPPIATATLLFPLWEEISFQTVQLLIYNSLLSHPPAIKQRPGLHTLFPPDHSPRLPIISSPLDTTPVSLCFSVVHAVSWESGLLLSFSTSAGLSPEAQPRALHLCLQVKERFTVSSGATLSISRWEIYSGSLAATTCQTPGSLPCA